MSTPATTSLNASLSSEPALMWREWRGKRVVVHAPENSYAARRAPQELRDAERLIEVLQTLLAPAQDGSTPVVIDLADAVPDDTPLLRRGLIRPDGSIVRSVAPDASNESLAFLLTSALVRRWMGENAAGAEIFVRGLAGVAAARAKLAAPLPETHAHAAAQLAAGKPVFLFGSPPNFSNVPNLSSMPRAMGDGPGLRNAPTNERSTPDSRSTAAHSGSTPAPPGAASTPAVDNLTATSFVAHVLEASGPEALRKFLQEYDPARRDAASLAAFQKPLAGLESDWQTTLRAAGRKVDYMAFARRVLPLLKPYKWRQLEVLLYIVIAAALSQTMPMAIQYLVGKLKNKGAAVGTAVSAESPKQILLNFGLILIAVYAANALLAMRQAYVTNWLNQRVLIALQEKMFAHLQKLGHNFYANAKTGDLMSRLTSDLQIVQQALSQVTTTGLQQLAVCLVSAGNVLYQTWRAGVPQLGLLVLLFIPLFAVSFSSLRQKFQTASQEQQRRVGETSSVIQETLAAQAVVKAFHLEEHKLRDFRERLQRQLKAALRLVLLGALSTLNVQMTMALAQLVVLCLGGYYVFTGRMPVEVLVSLTLLLPLMLAPIAGLAGVGQSVNMASGAMDRATELFDEPVTIADKPNAIALPPLQNEIRFENVTFKYGGERPILRDLSLTIPSKTNVAIVGPSGSGKSTLVNLLLRFWDADEGRVLFDNHDLRDVTLASLRGQIGFVFQDTFVFDTTLRENIRLGKLDATDAEVEAAARDARLEEFIQTLPAGLETPMGERGVRMSGGQRQRIAIARALLRNPGVLILDEATSALDATTEREILSTLEDVAKGRTTIAITHRLASAAKADRIYVLENGALIEEGSHAELIARDGLYKRLYQEQVGGLQAAPAGEAPRENGDAARLKNVPLFATLSYDDLQSLSQRLVRERFKAGEAIVRQGEAGEKFYFVAQGQAGAFVGGGIGSTPDTNEQCVNVLNEGDYFGETALLSGAPRNATVRASTPVVAWSLEADEFRDLLQHSPAIERAIEQTMNARRAVLQQALNTTEANEPN